MGPADETPVVARFVGSGLRSATSQVALRADPVRARLCEPAGLPGRCDQSLSKCGRSSGIGIEISTKPANVPPSNHGIWWMIFFWPFLRIV